METALIEKEALQTYLQVKVRSCCSSVTAVGKRGVKPSYFAALGLLLFMSN